ncbi:MAG: enoyl-CoA hydratase/isomerase family protein [Candidatus Xenobia bacterium]
MPATETGYTTLRIERNAPAATIVIDRPEVRNALNKTALDELYRAIEELDADDSIRGIILTGAGDKAFVSGADINELKPLNSMLGLEKAHHGQGLLRRIENLGKPIIAAVNGVALGGGLELAMACDIRLASPNAKVGLPEVKLGIIPGFGGTQRLPRLVGKGLALELICTGDIIDAQEALRIGLVNKVVPAEELLKTAQAMVGRIAGNGPLAVRGARRAVLDGLNTDMERGSELEALQFAALCGTEDKLEGLSAFLEKRPASFRGR